MEPIMKSLTEEQIKLLPPHDPETFEMYNGALMQLPKYVLPFCTVTLCVMFLTSGQTIRHGS